MEDQALEEMRQRLARIEAGQAISQLPSRYAMAIDARDLDTLVGLFIEDVDGGRRGPGRPGLRAFFDEVLRTFYRSIHQICGHTYELIDDDHARGSVYCRAEHEDGDGWYVMVMRYEDEYERRDGQWFFVKRRERHWYAVDLLERPGPVFLRWPRHQDLVPRLPHAFPSWDAFWSSGDRDEVNAVSHAP
jgi:hypothetical protein